MAAQSIDLSNTLRNVATALARPDCDTESILSAVGDYLIDSFDLGLVTVSERDPSDGSILRLYSSNLGAYELQGRKPANPTDWSRIVVDEQTTFVANDYETLSQFMFDHEKIRGLGLASIINIPVVVAGDVIAVLNCLGPTGHFSDEIIAGCEATRALVAVAVMAQTTPRLRA